MEIQRVLISDSCDPRCATILKEAGCEVTVKTDHTPEQLIENIKNFDALVVRSATKVTAAVINAAPNLKVRLSSMVVKCPIISVIPSLLVSYARRNPETLRECAMVTKNLRVYILPHRSSAELELESITSTARPRPRTAFWSSTHREETRSRPPR